MNVEIVPLDTLDAVDDFLELAQGVTASETPVSFDLETRADESNFEEWHPSSRIVSASFSWEPTRSYVLPLSHPAAPWSRDWVSLGRHVFNMLGGARFVGHNLKFDLRWIDGCLGVDRTSNYWWDTMAGSFLLDENASHGLEASCFRSLGTEPWKGSVDLKDAEREQWAGLARYNGLDTAHCLTLSEWQRSQLRDQADLGKIMWYVLMPTMRNLMRIERNGLLLDEEETLRRLYEASEERDRLYLEFEAQVPLEIARRYQQRFREQRLFDVGVPTHGERLSLAPTSKFFQEYAKASWPVMSLTEKNAPCWDAAVLKRLAARGHRDAALLGEYRKVDTQLNNFLTRWPHQRAADGRIHSTYKATTAKTGRLACEHPNLQQVDRGLKSCFRSRDGWAFVQADQSQIELRMAAWLSGDENLRTAYVDGRDVHRMTASAVTGKPEAEVDDEERYRAKAVNFGFLYGQLEKGFQEYAFSTYGIEVTLDEAERMRDRFFRLFTGLADYHERIRRQIRSDGYVRSPFGRVRRLPEIHSRDQMRRWGAERQAINHPIQSAASDLMLMGLNAVCEQVDPELCRVVGTVHDSLLMEVRADVVDQVLDKIGPLMVDPPALRHFGVQIPVPIVVEMEVGARWGDKDAQVRSYSSADFVK